MFKLLKLFLTETIITIRQFYDSLMKEVFEAQLRFEANSYSNYAHKKYFSITFQECYS